MKKIFLVLLLFIGLGISVFSQTCTITCTSYKENFYHNSSWVGWSNYWTDFDYYDKPSIRITNAEDGYYRLKYIVDGEVIMDYFVVYDDAKTKKIRNSWNNQNVYCYIDADGDHVFTENVSLNSLTKNPDGWKKSNANFYLWSYSENYGILLR